MPEDHIQEVSALLTLARSIKDRISNVHETHGYLSQAIDMLELAETGCGCKYCEPTHEEASDAHD